MASNLASLREREIVYNLSTDSHPIKHRNYIKKNSRVKQFASGSTYFYFIPVLLNVMSFILMTILAVGQCIAINSKLMSITICQNLQRMIAKNVALSKKV